MDGYKIVLRKVGLILIIVGVIDIGVMIYSIASRMDYMSSFNIFTVIGGIFLLNGNLRASQIVSWFSAFFLSALIGFLIMESVITPFPLLLAYLKNQTNLVIIIFLVVLAILGLLIWVYRSLTSEPIRAAIDEKGLKRRNSSYGLVTGLLLVIIVIALTFPVLYGDGAKKAKQMAAHQVGDGYRFHISSINISLDQHVKHVIATVTAYNDKEIKDIDVEWTE